MELKDVSKVVLAFVLVGMLLGVGLVVLNSLQKNTATDTTGNVSITWAGVGTNYTIQNLVSVTSITNSTGFALGTGNYTVTAHDGERNTNGRITVVANGTDVPGCTNGTFVSGGCTVTYVYDNFASDASAATFSTMTAISELPNNWFLILIVVLAASIVVGVLTTYFKGDR